MIPAMRADVRDACVKVVIAVVFALSLAWGYQLVRRLDQIERDRVTMDDVHVRGEQILLHVRTNVLLGSIYLRDVIIDGPSSRQEPYRRAAADLRDEAAASLRGYAPALTSSVERDHWRRLQTEVDELWASRHIVLRETGTTGMAQTAALLDERVVPSRDTVLESIDQLSALHAAANRWREGDTLVRYQRARSQLVAIGVFLVVVALGIALQASFAAGRLQRQLERQRTPEQPLTTRLRVPSLVRRIGPGVLRSAVARRSSRRTSARRTTPLPRTSR